MKYLVGRMTVFEIFCSDVKSTHKKRTSKSHAFMIIFCSDVKSKRKKRTSKSHACMIIFCSDVKMHACDLMSRSCMRVIRCQDCACMWWFMIFCSNVKTMHACDLEFAFVLAFEFCMYQGINQWMYGEDDCM